MNRGIVVAEVAIVSCLKLEELTKLRISFAAASEGDD